MQKHLPESLDFLAEFANDSRVRVLVDDRVVDYPLRSVGVTKRRQRLFVVVRRRRYRRHHNSFTVTSEIILKQGRFSNGALPRVLRPPRPRGMFTVLFFSCIEIPLCRTLFRCGIGEVFISFYT